MRRKPLAAMFVLLSAALVLGGNALLDAGWGSALRSIADRVLPNPEIAVSVNIFFTIFTNVFSPIAPTRMRRIRLRGCAAFGV